MLIIEDGVFAVFVEKPNTDKFNRVILNLDTEKTVAEFTALMRSALNCNSKAPKWAHDVCDTLAGIPNPYNARQE